LKPPIKDFHRGGNLISGSLGLEFCFADTPQPWPRWASLSRGGFLPLPVCRPALEKIEHKKARLRNAAGLRGNFSGF
jgi:hypothetical protein